MFSKSLINNIGNVFEKAQLKKDISNLEEASKTKGRRSKGSLSISNAKKRKSSA